MLSRLIIENFIIIDRLEIDFAEGFNVLSGETGAGKSIVIGGLMQIIGARSSKELIRKGCELSFLQAFFDLKSSNLSGRFGLDENGAGELIISREINQNGKSYSKINGELVPLKLIKDISAEIISVFGQDDRALLFSDAEQLAILDAYIGKDAIELKQNVRDLAKSYKDILHSISTLEHVDMAAIERERDNIAFQIADIDAAQLCEADEDIEDRYNKAKNYKNIIENAAGAAYMLDNDDEGSAIKYLQMAADNLSASQKYDEYFVEILESIEDLRYRLIDLSSDLTRYINRLESDPEHLRDLEKRLDEVNSLKRKYGNSIDDINKFRSDLDDRLEDLADLGQRRESLNSALSDVLIEYEVAANKLSELRLSRSKTLSKDIQNSLMDLSFKNAEFKVFFSKRDSVNDLGCDKIEFMVKLNAGSDFAQLRKVASGGELSRIMLAIQEVLGNSYKTPIMVFDEIDTGVSGAAANAMAKKLYKVSKEHQVFCISHLLQVTLYADAHYLIEKNEANSKTNTSISLLDDDGRVAEVYRMLSVGEDLPSLKLDAAEMLESAQRQKNEI